MNKYEYDSPLNKTSNDCSDNFEEGSDDWKRCKLGKRNEEYRAGLSEGQRQKWDTEQWHKGYRKEEEAAGFSDVQKIISSFLRQDKNSPYYPDKPKKK